MGRAGGYGPLFAGRLGNYHSDPKLLEFELSVKAKRLLRAVRFLNLECINTNADQISYFIFQAVLILLHCLRRDAQSTIALGWRIQIEATLEIVRSMTSINPSASRCRDVILSLYDSGLNNLNNRMSEALTDFLFEPTWDTDIWMAEYGQMLNNEDT